MSDIFEGKVTIVILATVFGLSYLLSTGFPVKISPRRPSEGWFNDPAWIGT